MTVFAALGCDPRPTRTALCRSCAPGFHMDLKWNNVRIPMMQCNEMQCSAVQCKRGAEGRCRQRKGSVAIFSCFSRRQPRNDYDHRDISTLSTPFDPNSTAFDSKWTGLKIDFLPFDNFACLLWSDPRVARSQDQIQKRRTSDVIRPTLGSFPVVSFETKVFQSERDNVSAKMIAKSRVDCDTTYPVVSQGDGLGL